MKGHFSTSTYMLSNYCFFLAYLEASRLVPLYDEIYNKHNRSYFEALEVKAEKMAKKYDCAFVGPTIR